MSCSICRKFTARFAEKLNCTPTHCIECKTLGMIDLTIKKCVVCNNLQPFYNYKNSGMPTHCFICKLHYMILVKYKFCSVCNNTVPTYGNNNELYATHCFKCKDKTMVRSRNVRKICILCNKKTAYYKKDKHTSTYCHDCKEENMYNISTNHKKCKICKFGKSEYRYINNERITHCFKCKLPDMVYGLTNPCIICKKLEPIFCSNNNEPTHCYNCRILGMQPIKKSKCIICKYNTPIFGYSFEEYPTLCIRCKLPDMIEIKVYRNNIDNRINQNIIPDFVKNAFTIDIPLLPLDDMMRLSDFE